MFYPSRIPTVISFIFVIMYYFHPFRLDKSSIAKQNLSHRANVICSGSPSRIRSVRRISLGMTTRPRSSILLTIPVAFISGFLQYLFFALIFFAKKGEIFFDCRIAGSAARNEAIRRIRNRSMQKHFTQNSAYLLKFFNFMDFPLPAYFPGRAGTHPASPARTPSPQPRRAAMTA